MTPPPPSQPPPPSPTPSFPLSPDAAKRVRENQIILQLMKKSRDQIVWTNHIKKGFFRRKIVAIEAISTYFVELQNGASGDPNTTIKRVLLSNISDITIANSHSVSSSTYSGMSTGVRMYRSYYGGSHSTSRTIGDLLFFGLSGNIEMTFPELTNPSGVRAIAVVERKRLLNDIKNFGQ